MRVMTREPLLILLLLLLVSAGGCATYESDIPWNAPQPWENEPTLPGFPGAGERI